MQNISEYPRQELVDLIQWYVDKFPNHRIKLTELLELAKDDDFADFDGEAYEAEEAYELEVNLILDPPDPDDKSGSDWADFV